MCHVLMCGCCLLCVFACRAVGLSLSLDDIQRISDRTPLLADLRPSGRYVMEVGSCQSPLHPDILSPTPWHPKPYTLTS